MPYSAFVGKIKKTISTVDGITLIASLGLFFYCFRLITSKSTVGLSMAGLPVSDASIWSACARSLGFFGEWPANDQRWCFRRPLFPAVNSIFFKFLGSTEEVLIAWNLIFCLALYFLVRQLRHSLGKIASIIIFILIARLWINQAAGQVMSEQLGMTLGVLSTYYFWKFISTRKLNYAILTIAIYSTSQVARPGNLLLIFLIVIFFISILKLTTLKEVLAILISTVMPFIAVKLFAIQNNLNEFMTSENTWATLYGLSKDNSTWTSAYDDFSGLGLTENEFWGEVKSSALRNILENPFKTIKFIVQNMYAALVDLPNKLSQNLFDARLAKILLILTITSLTLLLIKIFLNKTGPSKLLLLFFYLIMILEITTYGIVLKSDYLRAMSSSFPLFISILAYCIVIYVRPLAISKVDVWKKEKKNFLFSISVMPVSVLFVFQIATSTFMTEKIENPNNLCSLSKQELLLASKSDFVMTDSISTIPLKYWWQEQIGQLPKGILVQGLIQTKFDEIVHKNLYIEGLDLAAMNARTICFTETYQFEDLLSPIGFISVKFD